MITLKGGCVFSNGCFIKKNVIIENNKIIEISLEEKGKIIDCTGRIVVPGFVDPHVHLREPGYSNKETIKCGSRAAARGGYTRIFLMPNIKPNPHDLESLEEEIKIIKKDSIIEALPIGSITKDQSGVGTLADIAQMAPYVIGISDDGNGIKEANTMYEAMNIAKNYDLPIISHSEDKTLLYGGVVTKSDFAKKNNLKEIDPISETVELARNLALANHLNVRFHMCHISYKDSVNLIRYYKRIGCKVSAEVTPHHLLLNTDDLKLDTNYKMNPPIMQEESRIKLIEGIKDGTIDMIATDHAPHTAIDKALGFENAPFGIVGLETSFPLLYTNLVLKKIITLEKLLDLMSRNVNNVFKLPSNDIIVGNNANITVIDIENEFMIDRKGFLSKGKNTPFDKLNVYGEILLTIYNGDIVYEK